ncbi:MAG: glycosyltransferase family A protein [Lachnospiraceae bacterium]|nr:glycosyltransferase family A protein [Lachnospiraceae bacterium]
MKVLSITVPCYNSESYMNHCIESLLIGGEDVEIIIVDDGSSDGTAQIADDYKNKFPSIVKVIHQENGGHGEAVNTGLKNASGLYFKVVDSDDWVKKEALLQILSKLKEIIGGKEVLDMMISNFVYEKQGAIKKKVMTYDSALPKDRIFEWNDVKHFRKGQYMLMHSVIYRTKLLRECNLELPKHTFYVDNIFVFHPLPFVKTLYYMDVNFYRYFIGREDQSVNEQVMIGRMDQQLRVNKIMIDYMTANMKTSRKLRNYMINYLDIIMTVSSIMLIRSGTEEALEKKKDLWAYLKEKDILLYLRIRHGILGSSMNLPGKGGRKISVAEYKIAQRFIGFN